LGSCPKEITQKVKMAAFWDFSPCNLVETVFSEMSTVSIIRAITNCTSETTVNFYQTIQCNILKDCHLDMYHHENLKSHQTENS
jgi:hypothetical protein